MKLFRRHPVMGMDLHDHSPWDSAEFIQRRLASQKIASFFAGSEIPKEQYIHRKLLTCCDRASFYHDHDEPPGGKYPWKLLYTNFCHQRVCLTCQARYASKYRARLNQAIKGVERDYTDHRWLFVTFTVKNMPMSQLREAIADLREAWRRMSRYGREDGKTKKHRHKPFPAVGWIKRVEVSYGAGGTAHPHLHCLLFMPPAYFKGVNKYAWTHWDWVQAWRRALKADYDPSVKLILVKAEKSGQSKVCEIAKYLTKPSDLLHDPAWTREYASQLAGCQMYGSGGVAFYGRPDFAPPRDGEDLIVKRNLFADTDERKRFKWEPGREGYDLYD